MPTGAELFAVVEEYAALGDHRTGTDVDRATVEWFAQRLRALGGQPERLEYGFDQYVCEWEVTADGEPVEAIPLFYEGVGDVDTERAVLTRTRVVAGAAVPDFDAQSPELARMAEAAVLATDVPGGFLCVPNRRVKAGSGLPTLCVAGADHGRLADARVRVRLSARVEPGTSANVMASFGEGPPSSAVLLTTPLSGWFRCAGERGTGVAVCLAVAAALAEEHPVTVLGTNGHELTGLGLDHFLAASSPREPAIFHFGASVASGDADGVTPPTGRSRQVRATAWAGEDRRPQLEQALRPLGTEVRLPDDSEARNGAAWLGEASVWAPLGRPLVSIAGGFPLHHVPLDVPHLATNDQLLSEAYQAALAAARVLVDAARDISGTA